eukprot:622708_1
MASPGLSSRINELCQSSQLSVGIVTEAIAECKEETIAATSGLAKQEEIIQEFKTVTQKFETVTEKIDNATSGLAKQAAITQKFKTVTEKIDKIDNATSGLAKKEEITQKFETVTDKIDNATSGLAKQEEITQKFGTVTQTIEHIKTELTTQADAISEIQKQIRTGLAGIRAHAERLDFLGQIRNYGARIRRLSAGTLKVT